jgi:putative transposase
MSNKYKNKYTISSSRLQGYDYSQNGMYFVTICTKGREEFFGRIENGEIVLSEMGKIVQEELLKTPIIRSNVKLDEWVIMPNHLHVIFEICDVSHQGRDGLQSVSTDVTEHKNKFGPQINNLSSIIRGFKGATTNRIHQMSLNIFAWQPRFHDHIIRNDTSLNKIREYIQTNPQTWARDRNNPENISI